MKTTKFDVGHHPDEQPGDLAVNALVIFVVCLSSESSSPVLLVSTREVHYEEKNRKSRFLRNIYHVITCPIVVRTPIMKRIRKLWAW